MSGGHGYATYTRGCRCDVCREAKRAYVAERRRRGREGWNSGRRSEIEAGAARREERIARTVRVLEHVVALDRAGLTAAEIARQAGVNPGTPARLLRRPVEWVNPRVANALLSVPVPQWSAS